MKNFYPSRGGLVARIPAALVLVSSLSAVPVVWDNSNATGAWSTPANWDTNVEPTAADDLTFPLGLGGTITTTTTENALSLTFNDAYTLSGGTLALATGNSIHVANGVTATINNVLSITGGLSNTGAGTLVLGGSNTNPGGTVISAGIIRVANLGALGTTGIVTTVNGSATLEVASGITLDRPITLMHGGTVAGLGNATNAGKITIDAAATSVTLATDQASDVFTVGNGANDVTGGSLVAGTTVIGIAGPGSVRLGAASDFDGSWNIPSGRLELGAAAALGDQAASSVTLSGGTLVPRMTAATTFTGPASNLIVTADSALVSDRSTVSLGVTYTLGTLSIGAHTLTVAPGARANSGTAGITLGNVTLTGNPTFAVNDAGSVNGKLITGSILGGSARALAKTGAGDLAVTGGATDLPVGSTFTATGGGTTEMLFPSLGATTPVAITAAQNPFGEATVSVTDGALRLLADGSGTSAVQTYQLTTPITLGGAVTLDPDRHTAAANTTKTFELTGLTLATDTVLGMSGNNTHGVRLTGPLALLGDATLQGVPLAGQDGLLTLNGGISGAAGDSLTIAGGTSLLNLTINAAGTYGGGTAMSGSNVTLNAANALGTGATTLSGGLLIVNTDGALNGTVSISGGTLRVSDTDALSANPVSLNGGSLDIRSNAAASVATGTLTVSGTSTLNVANNGSGSSFVIGLPELNVSGNTVLTLTSANSYISNLTAIDLAGDLTLSHTGTVRLQSVAEDASPRRLVKSGTGTLQLQAASSHSGGTEVLAGILSVENASALGSGALTLGDTAGIATATAQFSSGLAIANHIIIRSGSTGAATLDSPTGGVTWNGGLSLQKDATLDNGSGVSTYAGAISGSGAISKISGGEWVLGNAANSFLGNVAISAGTLTVAIDGALGAAANGVNLTSSGILKIAGTFGSARTITVTGVSTDVNVTTGNTFTLSVPVAGAGTFAKGDAGTLEFAPSVDASARGAALNQLNAGTLRLRGALNLGNASPLTLAGGTLELLNDSNTDFAHPVTTAAATTTIHVDRAAGGAATNGRHTLGELSATTSNVTITGANGFGLTLDGYTTTSNSLITNNAPGTLILPALTGNPGTSSRTLTVRGSGDIEVTGATTEVAGTGSYGMIKDGTGRFTFGSSVTDFNRTVEVRDGVFDLNGLSLSTTGVVTMGGGASLSGARIETGAGGSLTLGAGLTFSNGGSPAGALFTGSLGIGTITQAFTVNDSSAATVDLTLDGPITGGAGSSISKSGSGTLRLSGAGNTLPGLVTVSAGLLELAKSSGSAIGTGGLSITGGTTHLLAAGQIDDSATVSLSSANEVFLDLNGFTETTGPVSLTQTDSFDYTAVKTGATGTLVLNGDLTLNNNTNSSAADGREVLITGSGSEFTPATDGILDLGGATRTIQVSTTTVGANEPKANATIETQIINGGILKTGARTLFLTNPNNTFAGGLQIAGGTVKSGGGSSLGLGPMTFTNALGVAAGIDFGTSTGPIADNHTLSGAGDVTFTYSGFSPNTLLLSGNFNTTQNLIFDVVNGSTAVGDTATLDLTGVIDDAAATISLTKIGNGTLKLDAGNTFGGGTTIQKGILSIAAESALGDSTADLTIDGGCLLTTAGFTLGRDLVFGPGGGSVRGSVGMVLDFPSLEWGAGDSAFFGPGTTVLSGATTGSGGNLALGVPTAFATASSSLLVGSGHVISLRGTAALPAGNLSFENSAVLELGNGDFTRALGTGPGEVQLATAVGGGWAAHGVNRIVNLGGAGATLVWGQSAPAFLFRNVPGNDFGSLVLGSATGTHTVDFQNTLDMDHSLALSFPSRRIVTQNGPAALDAKISGDILLTDPLEFGALTLDTTGALEISGDLTGNIFLEHDGPGTTTLSGTNEISEGLWVSSGTLVLANDASAGIPEEIVIAQGALLDASALTLPLSGGPSAYFVLSGTLDGDVKCNNSLWGNGTLTGTLDAEPLSYVSPSLEGQLHIGGNLNLDAGASLDIEVSGIVPTVSASQLRVTGAVNLSGSLYAYGTYQVALSDSFIFLLNDGTDPVNGTFAGLPEGGGLPIGGGLALQITYLANGDGGAVGNDIGLTVAVDTFSTDLALALDAPLAVDFGANFTINYTVGNFGPANSTGSSLAIPLPANAVLVGSVPAGTVNAGILTIPVSALAVSATTVVTVQFTAPGVEAAILVEPVLTANGIDGNPFDNEAPSVTAVMAGGCPILSTFDVGAQNGQITLGIDTITGVNYVLQRSTGLDIWDDYWYFAGDGEVQEFVLQMNEPKQFFRFSIVPYDGGGGGGE